jgi:16S rRNA (uracil1498-N3)-methyltransferase
MNIFYNPGLSKDFTISDIFLDEDESYHCVRVLRMKNGVTIHLTDGRGNLFQGLLVDGNPKKCVVNIHSFNHLPKHPFSIHIAIAPTKNIDRFEWFLEKATEIGIDRITPLICEHSERTHLRTERLQKILVSAMKQSMNLHLPQLDEPASFDKFIMDPMPGQKFIGYVEEKQEELLRNLYLRGSDVCILIGPEGDFSKTEVAKAVESGYSVVSLGNSRLRTETAGLVACVTIHNVY